VLLFFALFYSQVPHQCPMGQNKKQVSPCPDLFAITSMYPAQNLQSSPIQGVNCAADKWDFVL